MCVQELAPERQGARGPGSALFWESCELGKRWVGSSSSSPWRIGKPWTGAGP